MGEALDLHGLFFARLAMDRKSRPRNYEATATFDKAVVLCHDGLSITPGEDDHQVWTLVVKGRCGKHRDAITRAQQGISKWLIVEDCFKRTPEVELIDKRDCTDGCPISGNRAFCLRFCYKDAR